MTLDEIKKLMAAGETAKADEALKELLAKEPDNLQAKMLFGLCRQLMGDEKTFKRIYDEVAPKMERLPPSEQRTETVTLWKKYRALWLYLIGVALVLAGVGKLYFGRTAQEEICTATNLYGGAQYFDNIKQSGGSTVSEKPIDVNRNEKSDD